MYPHLMLALMTSLLISGCSAGTDQNNSVELVTDMNGFVLNQGKGIPRLVIGAGDTGERLIQNNRYLEKVIWLPKPDDGNVFDEMRLALTAQTEVIYNDGDMKLSVCAHSVNADGNENFKGGVAFIDIKLCEAPINDYKRALKLAKDIITRLERDNPQISNLKTFLRSAPQHEITSMGGKIWERFPIKVFETMPAPRDDLDRNYLLSWEEAEAHFASKLGKPEIPK